MEKKIICDSSFKRLDIYLSDALNLSRSEVKRLIDSGYVLVNGNVLKPSYKVLENDVIDVKIFEKEEIDLTAKDMKLDILYEDEYLAIVDKPKGLVVHPAKSHHDDTLVNGLLYSFNNLSNDSIRPGIVHRLDKDTSGLLVIAKDNKTHALLKELFTKREVQKFYKAIVYGNFTESDGVIIAGIKRDSSDRKKMCVSTDGKEAITNFIVEESFNGFSLVDVELITGRTHQIRVHFSYINKPVLGDPLYGRKKVYGDIGQYLHAYRIKFIHPITSKVIDVSSKLPDYFTLELEKLRRA